MQTLVDKIFPDLKEKDDIDEREFYARRGIQMKKEFLEVGGRVDKNQEESEEKAEASRVSLEVERDRKRKHVPVRALLIFVWPRLCSSFF